MTSAQGTTADFIDITVGSSDSFKMTRSIPMTRIPASNSGSLSLTVLLPRQPNHLMMDALARPLTFSRRRIYLLPKSCIGREEEAGVTADDKLIRYDLVCITQKSIYIYIY